MLDFFKPAKPSAGAAAAAPSSRAKTAAKPPQTGKRKAAAKALIEISINADSAPPQTNGPTETIDLRSEVMNEHTAKRQKDDNEDEQSTVRNAKAEAASAEMDVASQPRARPAGLGVHKQHASGNAGGNSIAALNQGPSGVVKRRISSSHMPPSQSIQEVTKMGFTDDQAIKALRASSGDVQRAINWIIENG